MKKRIISTFFILLIGVLIVPLFFSTPVSAETTATKVGWYSRSVNYEDTGGTPRYKYSGSIVILTNDENAYGTITVSGTEYHYSSKYTEIPINGTTGSINSIPSSVSGTFSPGDSGLDVVQLNPVQLEALLDVIRDSAGSDLSTIETTLDLIKTTLISINVNTENNDGESYLRLIDELLQDKLPRYQTLLTNIQNTDNNIYTQLSNIRSTLNTISIYVNQLNNKFPSDYGNSVLTKLDTLNTTCNAIITAIDTDFQHLEDNIDNLIDTITWSETISLPQEISKDNITYFNDRGNLQQNYVYLKLPLNLNTNSIYKFVFNISPSTRENTFMINDIQLFLKYTNDTIDYQVVSNDAYTYYAYMYREHLVIYINLFNTYGSSYYPILKVSSNRGLYNFSGDYTYQSISNDDIEFWELLYYMKSFRFYDQMTRETETTNNLSNINSQLQQNSQQMFSQEEEFNNNLNSSLGSITLPDNPFNNFGTMFGQSSRFLVYMFDQMTTTRGSPFGTVITFSLLLGLALLMIGKKGR